MYGLSTPPGFEHTRGRRLQLGAESALECVSGTNVGQLPEVFPRQRWERKQEIRALTAPGFARCIKGDCGRGEVSAAALVPRLPRFGSSPFALLLRAPQASSVHWRSHSKGALAMPSKM